MEPSWTEPPPFVWVFIGAGERPVCRRRNGEAALSGPERWEKIVRACKEEQVAEGRAIVRSDQVR